MITGAASNAMVLLGFFLPPGKTAPIPDLKSQFSLFLRFSHFLIFSRPVAVFAVRCALWTPVVVVFFSSD